MNRVATKSAIDCVTWLAKAIVAGVLWSSSLAAQTPSSDGSTEAQQQAMQKLNFLAGDWSGPVTIFRSPSEPIRLTQTERVEYKLDGLVLLIAGKSTGADGKSQFEALATIAYDEANHAYRIRAYNNGHYLDAELSVLPDGFSWGFQGGPARVVNTMHLTHRGQWQETTEVTMGDNPPHRSMEMLLDRGK